ncbi:ABC transporter ATP-binding protein [Promethearchaeum syntrophicum]|uniref:ABC transporter ATP-binding protein n=1 Tax=Promethearchaeum syntrophicum TaxID=2594042 RepID=A0A5B9D6U0_9ARCH|nr:ABC transporter ATP-binding protein [Candidatus Prometheoarchaeum syntrophicum]QEE14550.1 putative ABC transporter ATP-binding protein [Candidatus Prometheoarchaeum syntrophicum]
MSEENLFKYDRDMNSLKWVARLHLRYPFRTFYVLIGGMIEILIFLLPISITANVIEISIEGGGIANAKGQLWFLLGLAFVQAFLYFSVSFLNEVLAHRVTTDITQELFESLQYRSLTYHDSKDVGNIMARATGDTRTINIAISPAVRIIINVTIVWIVAFIITISIHYILALITVIVFIIFVITTFIYSTKILPLSVKARENFAEISEVISSSLTGVREIKSFVATPWSKKKLLKTAIKYQKNVIKEQTKSAWFYPIFVVTFYAALMIVLSIYFAYMGLFDVSIKDVILIAGFVSFLTGMSEEVQWTMWFLIRGKVSADRIYDIVSEKDPAAFEDGDTEFESNHATIEFKNVSFRYKDELPYALRNVSFRVEDLQTIAIVGPPGSGKSTITKLIQRLYLPTSGEILLSGRPISEYSNKSLRKNITTVEQDIFLFNLSVKDNIRYGKPEATDEEITNVAKIAEANDFILELPKKFENLIGEGGVRLSGGQAQRLSIARALLLNPSILLMDDGASALDARTEVKIQKAISEILRTRTTVITTHRLAIIAKADLVIIMEDGKIVGLGSHEQLIRKNPYYRRLFEKHYELPELEVV